MLGDAKRALEESKKPAMDAAYERLTKASHKLAEEIYRRVGPQPGAAGPGPQPDQASGPTPDGDVVDAEYVDVDPKPTN